MDATTTPLGEHPDDGLPPDLMDATKAARLLKVHMTTLHRWRLRGHVRAWRRFGRWVFSRAELLRVYQESPAARPLPRSRAEIDRDNRKTMRELEELGYA